MTLHDDLQFNLRNREHRKNEVSACYPPHVSEDGTEAPTKITLHIIAEKGELLE